MDEQQPAIDIRYTLQTLYNGKWVILSLVLLAVAAAISSNYFQTLRYVSWAQVQIDAPPFLPSPGSDLNSQSIYYSNIDKYFRTEQEKLTSRRMRVLFAGKLKGSGKTYESVPAEDIVEQLESELEVEPVEDTNLLTVSFSAEDPQKAADWLNLYLELFAGENVRAQEENVRQNREALHKQLDEIKGLLADQQAQMNAYVGGPGTAGADQAAADPDFAYRYQAAYDDTRRRRIEEEQKLSRLEAFMAPGADLTAIPNFDLSSGLRSYYERMVEAQSGLDRLRLGGKGEEHPEIVAKKLDLEKLRHQIQTELKKSVDSLRLNIAVLEETEENALRSYREKLTERRAGAKRLQEIAALEKLRENSANATALVEEKLRSLRIMESVVVNNVAIVERAEPDPHPVSERGALFVALCGLGGFILGIGVVLAAEVLNPKIRSVEDVQSVLNIPALGFLPHSRDFSLNELRESYNVLRTEVLFRRDMHQQRAFMITSSLPQEGKTTVALNLAKTLAAGGDRTLVVDFDLRKARLRTIVKESGSDELGVFTPVEGLELRLQTTDTPTLQMIVPAKLPEQAPYVLSQPEMKELIDFLKTRYDWVVIDTPPVGSVTDPVIIAPMVDTILIVIKHNFVDKKIARSCVAALSKVNPRIMGAVLNDIDLKKMGYYSYQAHYRYYTESEAK
jgi:capsular exopolysaccharide synthesis family protein